MPTMTAPSLSELIALKDAAYAAMRRAESYRVAGALGCYADEKRESAAVSFSAQMAYSAALTAYSRQDGQHVACGKSFNTCRCH